VIFYTPLHSTPPLGGPRQSIAIPFGVEKLEWSEYLTVKNFDMISRFDRIPACDRRTDRQTRYSPRYANASRGKNGVNNNFAMTYALARQMCNSISADNHGPSEIKV